MDRVVVEEERHGAAGAQGVGPDIGGVEAEGLFAAAEVASSAELSEEVAAGDAYRPSGKL